MPPDETAPTFDLQSHSTHSDGSLAPAEVVARAADAGVTLLALTDHDTVDGVPEALEAARVKNIELTPAVELSSVHAEHEDLHILGYGLDHTDATLLATLEDFRADRSAASTRWPTTCASSASRSRRIDHPLARPPASRQGAPDEHRRGASPATWSPAHRRTSRARGRRCTRRSTSSTPPAASPSGRTRTGTSTRPSRRCASSRRQGLDGVEAFYVTHTEEQTRHLHALATRLGLITTGSTDFHGPEHPRFNRFRGFSLHGLQPHLGGLSG